MYNTTILIPIHKLEDNDFTLLAKSIESLKIQKDTNFKISLVLAESIYIEENINKINAIISDSFEYNIIVNTGESDYQSQINFAVDSIDTIYFSILQYDDELLDNYTENINKYIKAYSYDMYIPINYEQDHDYNFIGFSNESTWSINHMEEFGLFDKDNTKRHSFVNYNLCGSTIKKEVFKNVGGFKKSMVKYHDYEFLLRMLEVGKKIYTIPKIAYKHVNGREDSLHDSQKDMLDDERKFWYELAKKEYHFDFDRKIEYTRP